MVYRKRTASRRASPRAAKRIVRAAGPMDRRLFVDTDKTDALFSPRNWIPATVAAGHDTTSLFTAVDYGEQALAFREKIRISTINHRAFFRSVESAGDNFTTYFIYWWYYIAGVADHQAITSSQLSPWSATNQDAYAALANVRTLKRGRLQLNGYNFSVAPTPGVRGALNDYNGKELVTRFKKKLWLKEDEGLYFGHQWWTLIRQGTIAGSGGVSGNLDTLIRWQRY